MIFGLPFHLGVSVVSDVKEMRGDTLQRWSMVYISEIPRKDRNFRI